MKNKKYIIYKTVFAKDINDVIKKEKEAVIEEIFLDRTKGTKIEPAVNEKPVGFNNDN